MALPVFGVFGTYSAAASAATPGIPASTLAGDILVCYVETDTGTVAFSGGTETWTQASNSPQDNGVGLTGTTLHVWWARASQDNPTGPTVTGTGVNHVVAAICRVRGCIASGNPYDVTSGGSNTVTDATITGATTTVADCLVLVGCSSGFNGTNSARFSAWTNADLANLTERFDQVDTINNGGGFGVASGEKASSGTYTSTTVTEAFAGHGYHTMALKPPGATTITKNQIVDALVLKTTTKTQVVDALLQTTSTKSQIVDGLVLKTSTKTQPVDAYITATGTFTKTQPVDSLIQTTATKTAPVDSLVLKTATKTQAVDARVYGFEAPLGVVATAISSSAIDVTWNPVPGATEYFVERGGATIAWVNGGSTSIYHDTGLSPSTLYTYNVRAAR